MGKADRKSSWYSLFRADELFRLLVDKDDAQLRSFCLSFIPYADDHDEITTLSGSEMIVDIVEYARLGSLPQCRRAEERQVMEMSDPEREALVFVLMGIQVPREVMQIVVSYLSIESELFGFGLVCWNWYLLALTSWRTVTVTNLNLYSIPLPILRSVSVLKIGDCPHWCSMDERPVTLLSELHETGMKYLWTAINPKKLSVLELPDSRLGTFRMILDSLSRLRLEGLRKIVFGEVGVGGEQEDFQEDFVMPLPAQLINVTRCDLSAVAPSLRSIRFPPEIEMCFEGVESVVLRYSRGFDLTELRLCDDLSHLVRCRSLRSCRILVEQEYRRTTIDFTDRISKLLCNLLCRVERFQVSGMLWHGMASRLPSDLPLLRRLRIDKMLGWLQTRSPGIDVLRLPVIEELELLGMGFLDQISLLESDSIRTAGLKFVHCSAPNLPPLSLLDADSVHLPYRAIGKTTIQLIDFSRPDYHRYSHVDLPRISTDVSAARFASVIVARACSSQKLRVTSSKNPSYGGWIEFRDFGRILVLSYRFDLSPHTHPTYGSWDQDKSPRTLRWLFADAGSLLRTRCKEVRCASSQELEVDEKAVLASLPGGWRFLRKFSVVEEFTDPDGTRPKRVLYQVFENGC